MIYRFACAIDQPLLHSVHCCNNVAVVNSFLKSTSAISIRKKSSPRTPRESCITHLLEPVLAGHRLLQCTPLVLQQALARPQWRLAELLNRVEHQAVQLGAADGVFYQSGTRAPELSGATPCAPQCACSCFHLVPCVWHCKIRCVYASTHTPVQLYWKLQRNKHVAHESFPNAHSR